ncbi:MATE efflux family protein [Psychromonas sp. CNPT3]|uniref:MATE family efflux transporter n=1 Tax=Psychromonas sp. CNPT3 TaxID=314282 RepID=UPI00006E916B|nr:MATE family efflux transporter [Psychromonas sp. CNPT3]AGH81308.1 MATE efflux family protein [Psychromonas sp. CNPT3]
MLYSQEVKKILKLSIPLFIAQFAQTAMGFVDTIMAGGVSANDMAAVSIAASIWLPCILFGVGILMAMIPLIAQADGGRQYDKIPRLGQQGLYVALLLCVPIALILYNAGWLVDQMQIEDSLKSITTRYLYAVIPAIPAFLLFQALRNYVEGLSLTKPAMVISFIGLLANIPLNWIFVYGKFGMPALGGVGCGIATTLVYWIMLFALFVYVLYAKKLQHTPLFVNIEKPNWLVIGDISKLGLPVAIAIFFEVTIFAGIAVLVAPLGALIVASHQIAMNFSSMVFMLPMSIASAVSIRVGFNLGNGSTLGAKNASYAGLSVGLSLAVVSAILTLLFREEIARLYTDNLQVINLAVTLIIFSALYQCVDALQVVAAGALRGYKEMVAIFTRTFVAYWVVGLPLGYILARTDMLTEPMGAKGFWVGITIGLTVAAILLGQRLYVVQKKQTY